ncbi:hypothetical protein Y032_0858g2721, partial [Ancylostoma ceylanicum]
MCLRLLCDFEQSQKDGRWRLGRSVLADDPCFYIPSQLGGENWVEYIGFGDEGTLIERCDLTGENRTTVVKLARGAHVYGIAVDPLNHRLYWTEGNYSAVKGAFLNGTNEFVIGQASLRIPQPHAISILDKQLFCNSLAGRAIMRISTNHTNGSPSLGVIDSSIYGPIGLVAVSLHALVPNNSACAKMKCSHLCFL